MRSIISTMLEWWSVRSSSSSVSVRRVSSTSRYASLMRLMATWRPETESMALTTTP
jgi:hypothetical protein